MSLTVLRWSIALVLGTSAALLLVSVAHAGHSGGLLALVVAGVVMAARAREVAR